MPIARDECIVTGFLGPQYCLHLGVKGTQNAVGIVFDDEIGDGVKFGSDLWGEPQYTRLTEASLLQARTFLQFLRPSFQTVFGLGPYTIP